MNTDAVLRVNVNDDGTLDILDFGVLADTKRNTKGLKQEEVPAWIVETISMLRIVRENEYVDDLGYKVSDSIYYIMNLGESNGT